jgi:hypothetical protein
LNKNIKFFYKDHNGIVPLYLRGNGDTFGDTILHMYHIESCPTLLMEYGAQFFDSSSGHRYDESFLHRPEMSKGHELGSLSKMEIP